MKTIKFLAVAALVGFTGLSMARIWTNSISTIKSSQKRQTTDLVEIPVTVPGTSAHPTDNVSTSNQRIQLALLLDTSNSMDGLIDQAKAQLWNIVNELAKAQRDSINADVTIALYEYGNDGLSVSTGYIRKVVGFTSDLDEISEKLFGLKTNGGSEYCGKVIFTSLTDLDWTESDSAFKVIYIAGNEEFTQGPVNYSTACEKAKSKNVVINSIFCGDYMQGINFKWQAGAKCSGGAYLNIDSDKKAIQVSTPYDDQIIQLNTQLNNTYIYYGSQGTVAKDNQVRQDENASKYSSANTAKRTLSKSSGMYKNEHWDLVDAYQKDKAVVKTIDKTTLPTELKSKTDEEIEAAVKQKTAERDSVKHQITELGKKREMYIQSTVTKETESENTLGNSMVRTIKTQATSKGFVFEK